MHARIGLALALGLSLSLAACHTAPAGTSDSSAEAAPVKEVTVAEVAGFIKAKSATIVDANGPDTRASQGVVPGAVLLTSSHDYALDELPSAKDTKLVFYCGGTLCRASDHAAKRASAAGYADVSVMRAGIRGWKQAGEPTETPRS